VSLSPSSGDSGAHFEFYGLSHRRRESIAIDPTDVATLRGAEPNRMALRQAAKICPFPQRCLAFFRRRFLPDGD
jgi:hypothetical protein